MRIKAVSFDFWNTLFRDIHGSAYQENRLKFFLETVRSYQECCPEKTMAAFNYASQEAYRIWTQEHRTPNARERLEWVLSQLVLELPEDVLSPMARSCGEMIHQFPPVLIEHVKEVLEKLSQHYQLAVISDTGYSPGTVLRETMARNGILDYFAVLSFSDEVGRSKPHESIFLATAQALGIAPTEMLHIGDLEFTDVIGARAVGAKAVLFAADLAELPDSVADYVVKSHLELITILAELAEIAKLDQTTSD
jgi:HAD superfamily hydrolase (TIGR01509 family)